MGLNLHHFWSLTPKQWEKYIKVYNEKEIERVKEKDMFNYALAKYIGWAVNDPKHYPKKPFSEKEKELKVMTDDEMEEQARRNTMIMGGVINGSNNG